MGRARTQLGMLPDVQRDAIEADKKFETAKGLFRK